MKRIMKKMHRSLSDIISNLPESVKETILACLPIQDAVRTSVLSTKWRYTWTKLPQLVFDDTFCSDLFCKTKDKLMTIIYQVLLFHHGPIPKFTCSLSGLKSCSEFDQLILFVSKKGIQELNLNIQNGELYKLPSSLFSCLQLKILTLHSCIFKSPPEFKGFSRLLKLELYEVVVTADILSRLISSSPLLERLSLQNSTSIDCLEINAPNLRFLLCEIHAGSICLKNTVQLASVAIGLMASMDVEEFEEAETSKLVTLFGNLPVIEFLELDYYYLRYMSAGGVPKRLPTTLNNLKFLYLNQICFGQLNEILVFLCLIRSSPNLVKIRILVHTDETADDVIDNPASKTFRKARLVRCFFKSTSSSGDV
ncbi:hypothetical protein HYC85_015608 [Camellia sinensis]|uniref:F-box domain-containing protein n=1 Tax=Camellia sinensis TaxID=4442 RepID=A0A7J7GXJ3_CAMSI|nr:hypothetical protein HYC85_015608 [Camellia sinensis]